MGLFNERLTRLRKKLAGTGLDGLMIGPGPNLTYLTGVRAILTERPLILFVTLDDILLVTPKLEEGLFRNLGITMFSYGDDEGVGHALERIVRTLGIKTRWGVEGRMPFRFVHPLHKYLDFTFENADQVLLSQRAVKDVDEIENIRRSGEILRGPLLAIAEMVRPGVTELRIESETRMRLLSEGAHSVNEVLIQSGPNSANPHALPSDREIREGEPVIIDIVCTFNGYHADITRTLCAGENRKFSTIYNEVLNAELTAISAVAPGIRTGDVDKAARGYLGRRDLGEYFIHRTGHGLGLEPHEAPFIVPNGDELLEPGMVHTIEPGVYLPGEFGVRIEDDLLVKDVGRQVLTRVPTEYGWWIG